MNEYLQMAQDVVASYGVNIVAAMVIYIIGKWVAGRLRAMVIRLMEKSATDPILIRFVSNMVYGGLLIFVVLAALSRLGLETTSFIAILGAAGLAVGLALQGSLSNFAAGVLMIIFRPFKVGDFIEAAGVAGIVEEVSIFTTHIRSGDNKAIIIPNGSILSGNIVNYSSKDTRRIDMVVGISYDADIQHAKKIIQEILDNNEKVLKDPLPTIGVLELADSSVNFAVRPWVATGDYWPAWFDLNETIKMRFDAEGIGIPYPQRDVHLYQAS